MRVRFEQVDSIEKEQALIRAVEKSEDVLAAIDLLKNGSDGLRVTKLCERDRHISAGVWLRVAIQPLYG